MSVRQWLRRFRELSIEIEAHDRFALGTRLCGLRDDELAALHWSDEQRRRLYKQVMARNPRGYDGWHPGEEELVPVTMPRTAWEMVATLCTQQAHTALQDWQTRISQRIAARIPQSGAVDRR